ncbi:MAG: hypothetical protein ABGX22_14685, partial [Pirellulaceae bacterium]
NRFAHTESKNAATEPTENSVVEQHADLLKPDSQAMVPMYAYPEKTVFGQPVELEGLVHLPQLFSRAVPIDAPMKRA